MLTETVLASPRPLPTKLKIANGNPGQRRLNDQEPQPSAVIPSCPKWLSAEAKRQWRAIVPELHRIGILTKIDVVTFIRYCELLAEWKTAYDWLQENGHDQVVMNSTTGEVLAVRPWPASKRKRDIEALLLRYEQEFGLTPSSRSRIHAKPVEEDELELLISNAPLKIAQ